MRHILLTMLGASALFAGAHVSAGMPISDSIVVAQNTRGEADEKQSKAMPAAKTTKEERTTARTDRRKKTAEENKAGQIAKAGEADPSGAKAVPAAKKSKEERQKARKERLETTAADNKAGKIPKGEGQ